MQSNIFIIQFNKIGSGDDSAQPYRGCSDGRARRALLRKMARFVTQERATGGDEGDGGRLTFISRNPFVRAYLP